jgi:CRISPR-associated protein Csc3
MLHRTLLLRVVEHDAIFAQWSGREALRDFVQFLSPEILRYFADTAALGGATEATEVPAGIVLPPTVRRQNREHFGKFSDQSLATHIFNGTFVGSRLAAFLGNEAFPWSDALWRLWMLGFVLHDYGKACGINIYGSHLDDVRSICHQLGEKLQFDAFYPEWQQQQDDIVYLAQNYQTREEAYHDTGDFALQLPARRRNEMRLLGSFADILIHIEEPRRVLTHTHGDRQTDENLQNKLRNIGTVGDRAPVFAYHQVAEVRGLLTNLIHQAVQEQFQAAGYQPYLYFAEGVVYLTANTAAVVPNLERITDAVWQRIRTIIGKPKALGFSRDGKGIKATDNLFNIFTIAEMVRRTAIYAGNMKNTFTRARLDSLGITDPILPADIRTDQLAEFLAFLKGSIANVVISEHAADITPFFLRLLHLEDTITVEEANQQRGGTPLGWYYVAARYISRRPELRPEQIEELFAALGTAFLEEVERLRGNAAQDNSLRTALNQYVARVLDVNGIASLATEALREFEAELARYTVGKAMNRPLCSLCSSPYESQDQSVTVVLFKPQQYSAKNKLGGSHVIRGICPICSIEMLLRQAFEEGNPGKMQDEKCVYVSLYPAYFFTPEMAQMIQTFTMRLKDLNLNRGADSLLGWLRHQRDDGTLDLAHLADFELFLNEDQAEPIRQRTIRYSEQELSGLTTFVLRPEESKSPTDTDAWILPAFYALALPLVLNVKAIATTSFVPLFVGARDFHETSIIDGVHPIFRQALGNDTFRVQKIRCTLKKLLSFYDLHTEVFADGFEAHWGQLNAVVRDVNTDPLMVFAYFDRRKRAQASGKRSHGKNGDAAENGSNQGSGIPVWDQQKFHDIYLTLGGTPDMGIIGKLVESYATFYRTRFGKLGSAYAVLKPFSLAIDTTVDSLTEMDADDLIQSIAGVINDLIERISDHNADGWDPIRTNREFGTMPERAERSRRCIHDFAQIFVKEVFLGECMGDRALLRERANVLRSAARFYYLTHFSSRSNEAVTTNINEGV